METDGRQSDGDTVNLKKVHRDHTQRQSYTSLVPIHLLLLCWRLILLRMWTFSIDTSHNIDIPREKTQNHQNTRRFGMMCMIQ